MNPEQFAATAHALVLQETRTLELMHGWIAKARAHAGHRKFDADLLLTMRLAPDMFPLVRQYGSACDNVKLQAARLTGKTAPVHPDNQTRWDEVAARVEDVVAWVRSLRPEDFANASEARAMFPWLPGKMLPAQPYVLGFALPNIYFHASMAYAILRHNGVELGKGDFLGEQPFQDA